MSDTHDNYSNTKKALNIFKEENVEKVIHAGDFTSPKTVSLFQELETIAVFGNRDKNKYELMEEAKNSSLEFNGGFHSFSLDSISFALYHGTSKRMLKSLISSDEYDIVIHGHTHEVRDEEINGTRVLNPGSCKDSGGGGTIIVLDTNNMEKEVIKV